MTATSKSGKLKGLLGADPKKGLTLTVLGLVLVILWGRMLLGTSTPAPARGQDALMVPARTDNAVVPAQGHGSGGGSSSLQEWARKPVVPIDRNLFEIPIDYYPSTDGRAPGPDGESGGFWDQLAKSMSTKADQQEQRRILIDNVRALAASLKLQSTMMGNQPSAMVNGEMVREGSTISGFRIQKIEARRLIVEHEGVRLEILMK